MKRGMTIEFLQCRADLNFEVDLGVNGGIGRIVTTWDVILNNYIPCQITQKKMKFEIVPPQILMKIYTFGVYGQKIRFAK